MLMSVYTAFRCPLDTLNRAKAIARVEHRSLSNYIIHVLEQDAARRYAERDQHGWELGAYLEKARKEREYLHSLPRSGRFARQGSAK